MHFAAPLRCRVLPYKRVPINVRWELKAVLSVFLSLYVQPFSGPKVAVKRDHLGSRQTKTGGQWGKERNTRPDLQQEGEECQRNVQ